ncbi:hypothetical protein GGR42_002601 [Saonia flava]|uniref:Lipocalin-like domain-containing protein n=1 Tax=Saonia flava TaxID=523696 RepID=A0A846QYW3_9FLAO|nr:hypothetical protein [Saonia flava]NJB72110.1 hypothetical protein [Saonia flava]
MRYLSLFIFLLWVSCEKENGQVIDNEIELSKTNLLGKWKLEATRVSPGYPVDWSMVENGNEFIFLMDGSYTEYDSKKPSGISGGIYSIEDQEFYGTVLLLKYEYLDQQHENRYTVELSSKKMIMSGVGCIEGCSYSYKRIN